MAASACGYCLSALFQIHHSEFWNICVAQLTKEDDTETINSLSKDTVARMKHNAKKEMREKRI